VEIKFVNQNSNLRVFFNFYFILLSIIFTSFYFQFFKTKSNKTQFQKRSWGINIGRYQCSNCGSIYEEDHSFGKIWKLYFLIHSMISFRFSDLITFLIMEYLPGASVTNNPIESYYSKSLKTDSKKRFRTDKGIENQIKLTEMRRLNLLNKL